MSDAHDPAHRVAELAARDAYGLLIARLTRRTRDIASAQDALSAAFVRALEHWPRTGIPQEPVAWLTTVALRLSRDDERRGDTARRAQATLQLLAQEQSGPADERLGLMLAVCHPAIDAALHGPLVLQTVFAVTAEEMAPAFLVPATTLGQRLSRAKSKIRTSGIPFEPDPPNCNARLGGVLSAVYALATIAAVAPPSARASDRARDALHLARMVARLAPDQPEALGLAALLAFMQARSSARRVDGRYVPLSAQDPASWDRALIAEGEACLAQAARFGVPGPYQLEAAIHAVHCDRARTGVIAWDAVAAFYDALARLVPSTGLLVARAAAVGEARGPGRGLALLERIPAAAAARYQPYWAVRAHLLRRAGEDAAQAFSRAIAMSTDSAARTHLARESQGKSSPSC